MLKLVFHLDVMRISPHETIINESEHVRHECRTFVGRQRIYNMAHDDAFLFVFPPAASRQVRLLVSVYTRAATKLAVPDEEVHAHVASPEQHPNLVSQSVGQADRKETKMVSRETYKRSRTLL